MKKPKPSSLTSKPTVADVLRAVRDRGSDVEDLRDAAHEACHALEFFVPDGEWDRESIDAYCQAAIQKHKARARAFALRSEIFARAVEQVVCADLGAKCPPVEMCAMTACKEAIAVDRVHYDLPLFILGVKEAMKTAQVRQMADRVIALPRTEAKHSGNLSLPQCDLCGNHRRDVRSVGKDSNGDPDAPGACGTCVDEHRLGNVWDREAATYVPAGMAGGDWG